MPWTTVDGNIGCVASISHAPTNVLSGSSASSIGIFGC
jgi:hypothetical protein